MQLSECRTIAEDLKLSEEEEGNKAPSATHFILAEPFALWNVRKFKLNIIQKLGEVMKFMLVVDKDEICD